MGSEMCIRDRGVFGECCLGVSCPGQVTSGGSSPVGSCLVPSRCVSSVESRLGVSHPVESRQVMSGKPSRFKSRHVSHAMLRRSCPVAFRTGLVSSRRVKSCLVWRVRSSQIKSGHVSSVMPGQVMSCPAENKSGPLTSVEFGPVGSHHRQSRLVGSSRVGQVMFRPASLVGSRPVMSARSGPLLSSLVLAGPV